MEMDFVEQYSVDPQTGTDSVEQYSVDLQIQNLIELGQVVDQILERRVELLEMCPQPCCPPCLTDHY